MENLLQHSQVYGAVAETKITMGKSTCLALEELEDLQYSVPHEVKILGVVFGLEVTGQKIWDKTKVKLRLGPWSIHGLIMVGGVWYSQGQRCYHCFCTPHWPSPPQSKTSVE